MHFRVHHLSVKHRVLERAQDNIPSFQAFCGDNRKSKCAFGILKGVAEQVNFFLQTLQMLTPFLQQPQSDEWIARLAASKVVVIK